MVAFLTWAIQAHDRARLASLDGRGTYYLPFSAQGVREHLLVCSTARMALRFFRDSPTTLYQTFSNLTIDQMEIFGDWNHLDILAFPVDGDKIETTETLCALLYASCLAP